MSHTTVVFSSVFIEELSFFVLVASSSLFFPGVVFVLSPPLEPPGARRFPSPERSSQAPREAPGTPWTCPTLLLREQKSIQVYGEGNVTGVIRPPELKMNGHLKVDHSEW